RAGGAAQCAPALCLRVSWEKHFCGRTLGATLAVVALMTGQWPLLVLIGIIPLSEALSVVLQILFFKLTKGKRLFKMAPLHLHFELLGWSETQVVQRFWLIGLLAAMIGVGLALV
ncbi:MAG: hypothetical protein MUP03_03990, partial [Anaerolineales bacterium]|nr:hypothetical protein [Anaerolineales bacterium]